MKAKQHLPQVTVICIAGNRHGESIAAMYKTMAEIDAARYVLLTNVDLTASGIEVINVGGLDTWEAYNHFVIKELYKYFDTSHCLIIQHDGYVLNGDCWTDEFLEYDIIGARGLSDGRTNFNGGFALRSWRLQSIIAWDDFIDITAPEDEVLCRLYRKYIEERHEWCKYPTFEIADRFAYELHEPLQKTFGFHNYHWKPYRETVVIKRNHALGDVAMTEPVMHYFHQKGYQVALDTQPEFLRLFIQHYFPVVPKLHLNPKLPYREINLDMAYEVSPKEPVLKSYYNIAGIKDGVMRNPKLNILAGDNQRLFHKYAIVHINYTDMPYRNLHGINWKEVVEYLQSEGYLVFQIGKHIEEEIGIHFNHMTIEYLMFFMKGASLFIGSDSGPSFIAAGFNIPSVLFFGSVNPAFRHINMKNIRIVQSECPKKETKHCYHNKVGVVGSECIYDAKTPPCTVYSSAMVIDAIKSLAL